MPESPPTQPPVEMVVLLDPDGDEIGRMEKLDAHRGDGHLHRAFSVFLIDRDGRVLLQRRAGTKHHFRGLWSNTCCSHPRPDESVAAAGARRVRQELGIDVDASALAEVGAFVYRARDHGSDLVEHEWDHVLVGRFDGSPTPDPAEVDDWRWVDRTALADEMGDHPGRFTPWLGLALAVLDDLSGV